VPVPTRLRGTSRPLTHARGVRYAAWHANAEDMEKLRSVVDFYSSTLPPADRDASLAAHLNAYNA